MSSSLFVLLFFVLPNLVLLMDDLHETLTLTLAHHSGMAVFSTTNPEVSAVDAFYLFFVCSFFSFPFVSETIASFSILTYRYTLSGSPLTPLVPLRLLTIHCVHSKACRDLLRNSSAVSLLEYLPAAQVIGNYNQALGAQRPAPWPCRANKPHASTTCKSTCPGLHMRRTPRRKPVRIRT